MSIGACFCPCVTNGHSGATCTGEADTSRPRRPSYADNLELPVCGPCAERITDGYSNPLVAPLDAGYVPDVERVTATQVRSAVSNWPTRPLPPGRS